MEHHHQQKHVKGPVRRVQSNDVAIAMSLERRRQQQQQLGQQHEQQSSSVLNTSTIGALITDSPKRGTVRRCPSHSIAIVSTTSFSSAPSLALTSTSTSTTPESSITSIANTKDAGSSITTSTTTTTIGVLRRAVKRNQSQTVSSSSSSTSLLGGKISDTIISLFSSSVKNLNKLSGSKLLLIAFFIGLVLCLLDVVYIGYNFHSDTTTISTTTERSLLQSIPFYNQHHQKQQQQQQQQHLSPALTVRKFVRKIIQTKLQSTNKNNDIVPSSMDNAGGSRSSSSIIDNKTDEIETDNKKKWTIPVLEGFTQHTGKGPIIELVKEALGQNMLDDELINKLPNVEDIISLYGSKPIIYGLETCSQFQYTSGYNPSEHFITTAGTFNTGTNLMSDLLIENCYLPKRYQKYKSNGIRWQVTWGKHTPIFNETFRLSHHISSPSTNATTQRRRRNRQRTNDSWETIHPNQMFPAVMIRDPFKWMQSMCRHPYAAQWLRDVHNISHCPNLIPVSVKKLAMHEESVPVQVQYKKFSVNHTSLVNFYNEWYNDYINATFPRIIVRFEDVIFYPKQITKVICECAGGKLIQHKISSNNTSTNNNTFKYITDSAKKGIAHGKSSEKTSYIDALIKYGTKVGRYNGYYNNDILYANNQLDTNLMKLFNYQYGPTGK